MVERHIGENKPVIVSVTVFCLVLVGFRLYLPSLVKNYCNRVLDRIPGYHGHIEEVTIKLWRGAYSIVGLNLLKTGGQVPVPFFSAEQIDFSLHWNAIFHGQLVGKVEIDHPHINFVAADKGVNKQTSIDKSWQRQAKRLFPLRISRLGIKDGEVHFRNYEAEPKIDIYIHHVYALATNLTNSKKLSNTLKATLEARGLAMSTGKMELHLEIDPLVEKPTFKGDVTLEGLALPELNDFFKHYLAVEVKDGMFSFYGEGAARDGLFKGYAKPLLNKVDFVKIKEGAGLGEWAKAIVVKFVSYVMKNHSKDRIATRIEISGDVKNPTASIWSAISSFLGNWLIRAIAPGVEGSVHFQDVQS